MSNISKFANAYAKKEIECTTIPCFIENVMGGLWQDLVTDIRAEKDKAKQQELKKKLPAVTISGTFSEGRADANLKEHSGYIAVDIDNLIDSVTDVKAMISQDPYIAAMFTSAGGYGLCVLVKINPKKHTESFAGLQEYFDRQYKIIIDPSGRNPSRLRYVSFDPAAHFTAGSKVFAHYPEKAKIAETKGIYFMDDDITHVFEQISSRRIDVTGDYHQWLKICFAMADHYGASGLEKFIAISQYSQKYDRESCEKHYERALKRNNNGKKATIATLLWYCKQEGIRIISPKTREVVQSAKYSNANKTNTESVIKLLDFQGVEDAGKYRELINQVKADAEVIGENAWPLSVQLRDYWKACQNKIRRHEITGEFYKDGKQIDDGEMVNIAIDASEAIGKDVSSDMVFRMLQSRYVTEYNPLKKWLTDMILPSTTGHIKALAESINALTPPGFAERMLTLWMVSLVRAAFGTPSDTCLVLKGGQGIGKSSFFLNLMPDTMPFRHKLVYEGGMQRNAMGDNKRILATKWLIIDDEFETIDNLKEEGFKAILTAKTVHYRLPYTKTAVDRPKLATFAATTNSGEFLKDSTGNRRFVVFETKMLDWDAYNAIDKDELWREVYHLYIQYPELTFTKDDMAYISHEAEDHRILSREEEMVNAIFRPCNAGEGEFLSATKVLGILENGNNSQKLSRDSVAKAMVSMRFDNNGGKAMRVAGVLMRGFWVTPVTPVT